MSEHPINNLMSTVMENIKGMIDVDTVIGEPISIDPIRTVIPFSKVSFGFISGGGELCDNVLNKSTPLTNDCDPLNFIGGASSGVSIKPLGFIVSDEAGIKLLSAEYSSYADRIIDSIPRLIEEIKNIVTKHKNNNN